MLLSLTTLRRMPPRPATRPTHRTTLPLTPNEATEMSTSTLNSTQLPISSSDSSRCLSFLLIQVYLSKFLAHICVSQFWIQRMFKPATTPCLKLTTSGVISSLSELATWNKMSCDPRNLSEPIDFQLLFHSTRPFTKNCPYLVSHLFKLCLYYHRRMTHATHHVTIF